MTGRGRAARSAALPALMVAAAGAIAMTGCRDREGAGTESPGDPPGSARFPNPFARRRVHQVRIVSARGEYAFLPAELRVRPGDIVRFVLTGPHPESVAFDTTGVGDGARAFLRTDGLTHGPLLTLPGQTYEVSFEDAPVGNYPFYSVANVDRGMRGEVVVQ